MTPGRDLDAWTWRTGPEEGFATPVVLGLAAVLGAVAVLLSALGVVAGTRHRAVAAADLTALAAAGRVLADPCEVAQRVAADNGAALLSCLVTGDAVEVVVSVRPGGRLGLLGSTSARARAGPAARLSP